MTLREDHHQSSGLSVCQSLLVTVSSKFQLSSKFQPNEILSAGARVFIFANRPLKGSESDGILLVEDEIVVVAGLPIKPILPLRIASSFTLLPIYLQPGKMESQRVQSVQVFGRKVQISAAFH